MCRKIAVYILLFSFLIPVTTFAHAGIPNAPTTVCGSIDSADFSTHVTNQMDSRISGVSSSTAIQLFSTKGNSQTVTGPTSTDWVRNTGVWSSVGNDVDWTGVSPWNQPYDGYSSRYQKAGALISPRHVVLASHWYMPVNSTLLFVSNTNEMIYRTLTGVQSVSGTDITIGVLDSDVPDSITYYPLIASSTLQSLVKKYEPTWSYDIPMVVYDQEKKAIVHFLNYLSQTFIGHGVYTTGPRAFLSESVVSGDSGSPAFIVVDDRPILLFTHYTASAGPSLGSYISQINTIMTNLGGGYQVTQYDPTCFTRYTPNNLPVFTSGSAATTTNAIQDSSTLIQRYSATDADVSHTLSYSMASLFGSASSTLRLNPSEFFSLDSTTGELRQIAAIDNSIVGNTLTLTVAATDSGSPAASTTVSTSISVNYPSITSASRLGNTIQIQFSESLDPTSIPQASDLILKINGVAQNISRVQISGSSVSIQSEVPILGGDSLTIQYTPGSRKIRASAGAYASAISIPLSVSNTHAGDIDLTFNPGTGFNNLAFASTLANGKLVAVGSFTAYNGVSTPRIARINTDGSLDTTFSVGTGPNSTVTEVTQVEGGKLLIGGLFTSYNGTTTNRIARLNTDGSLDTSFNIGTGFNGIPFAFCTSAEGKYYIGGSFTTYNGTTANRIARINTDGSLDTSFAPVSGASGDILDCVVQADGKLIITGTFDSYDGVASKDIVRINTDGTRDATFTPVTALQDYMGGIYAVSLLSDNRIVVGGISSSFVESAAVAILSATGTVDTKLASGIEVDTVLDIVSLSNNKFILVGGYLVSATPSNTYRGIVQFNGDGTIDTSFAPAAGFTFTYSYPYSIEVDSTGNLYVVGLYTAYNGVDRNGVVKIVGTTVQEVVTPTVTTVSSGAGSGSGGGGGGGGGGFSPPVILTPTVTPRTATPQITPAQTNSVARTVFANQMSVKEVQQFLNNNGYKIAAKGAGSPGKETNSVGGLTRVALMKYQKTKKIPQTGVVDTATKQAMTDDKVKQKPLCVDLKFAIYPKNTIRYGAKNNSADVQALELFLNTHENLSLPVDGVYSLADRNAVIKWQEKNAQAILKPAGLTKGTGNVSGNSLRVIQQTVGQKGCL